MSKAPKHVPVGHLFSFPDAVREWMLQETGGHMVQAEGAQITVYCGETRGSFIGKRHKPLHVCRFCHCTIEEGQQEERPGGFVLWHRASRS